MCFNILNFKTYITHLTDVIWLAVSVLQPGELIIYYELEEGERSSSRGIVEVCPDTHRWERQKLSNAKFLA